MREIEIYGPPTPVEVAAESKEPIKTAAFERETVTLTAANRTDRARDVIARLKADFDISQFSPEVQAILKGLKKYGMFVADNGIDWAISIAPDPRIPELHAELRRIQGAAFEVVVPPQ